MASRNSVGHSGNQLRLAQHAREGMLASCCFIDGGQFRILQQSITTLLARLELALDLVGALHELAMVIARAHAAVAQRCLDLLRHARIAEDLVDRRCVFVIRALDAPR